METWDVVVVGAGIAGISAIRALVEDGARRRLLLINGESVAPYKRTKLSKSIASGVRSDSFLLEPEAWYTEHGVTIMTGISVVHVDATSRQITLSDGSSAIYRAIILATGSEPLFPQTVRPHESESYHVLRSMDDLSRIQEAGRRAKRVLVAGMGVLAVEVASELRALGKKVTLVGATAQLMPRHLNQRGGEVLEELLISNGVRLQFQEEILSFERRKKGDFAVATIREHAVFDMVVLCIGVAPRTKLASGAGLEVGRGVVVNDLLQTDRPEIFAAGDCAEHEGGLLTDLWHAAEHQGELAGRNAAAFLDGRELERFNNPQFRLKLEVFGSYFFSIGKPRTPLEYELDEHENGERYQCFYYKDGRLVGAVMINDKDRAREYQQAVRDRLERDEVVSRFLN